MLQVKISLVLLDRRSGTGEEEGRREGDEGKHVKKTVPFETWLAYLGS